MKEHQSYMWSVTDWRTDELFLTLNNHEKGVYRHLLDECWVNGSIPDKPEMLCSICYEPLEVVSSIWQKIRYKFIAVSDGRVTSKRMEEDRLRLDAIRDKRQAAGKLGGLAKAKQMPSKVIAKRSQTQTADSRLQTEDGNSSSATADRIGFADFEDFWRRSTKRGSKKDALTEWRKIALAERIAGVIESGMAAWQQSEQWQDETKQPHVFRWLRRRGWEELVPHRNGNGSKPSAIAPCAIPPPSSHCGPNDVWQPTEHAAACGHVYECDDDLCQDGRDVRHYCPNCVTAYTPT